MTAGTIIVSKCNSIRWAHRDGLLRSMGNQLSCEEVWSNKPPLNFAHTFFQNDIPLIQVKAGESTTLVLTMYNEAGTATIIPVTETNDYTEFIIYDYLIALPTLGKFRFNAKSTISEWDSEWIEVVETDNVNYRLLQWTNLDPDTNTFEFDYTTATAVANVNFARLVIQDLIYSPGGEREIYDNQNEKSIIKANAFTNIMFQTEILPRQICEQLFLAMSHDRFLVNDVAYIVEKLPDIEQAGAGFFLSAEMTINLSLGLNTHDIGFNCDLMSTPLVIPLSELSAIGARTLSATAGYSINQIILEYVSGTTVTVKIGSTVGGDNIMRSKTLTAANTFHEVARNFVTPAGMSAAWLVYLTISGGLANVYVQTIKSKTT